MVHQGWRELSFSAPGRLWWLLALVVAGAVLAAVGRRRGRRREAYAAPALRRSAAPTRPGWQRWVASGILGLAVVTLTTAFARPQVPGKEQTRHSVVVIALDTSSSMTLDDIAPSRFAVARDRARSFIQGLPSYVDAGLVAFSTTARVVAAPTPDHTAVAASLDTLQPNGHTAMGDALALAVTAAKADLAGGSGSAARIVLLSDGASSGGRPLSDGVAAASAAGIPVSTIAFGTDGTTTPSGKRISEPVDTTALEQVANQTGGQYYRASASSELADVYKDIGSSLLSRTAQIDVSDVFAGVAVLLLLAAAVPTLLTSGRLVP